MKNEDLVEYPSDKAIRINNKTCVYCGKELTSRSRTKEHVIARRFVPKGMMNGQWNLIVWACSRCNRYKAGLEGEMSALSMQPNASGEYADNSYTLMQESARKSAGSHSTLTRKPIRESVHNFEHKLNLGPGLSVTIGGKSPPQPNMDRLYRLAGMQLQAFFYMSSYDETSEMGGFWPGEFVPCLMVPRTDWGNSWVLDFVRSVRQWKVKVIGNSADGYFRIIVRKLAESSCWAWALEWNKNYRIVGCFGEREVVQPFLDTIPPLECHYMKGAHGEHIRMRAEKSISEEDDCMFEV